MKVGAARILGTNRRRSLPFILGLVSMSWDGVRFPQVTFERQRKNWANGELQQGKEDNRNAVFKKINKFGTHNYLVQSIPRPKLYTFPFFLPWQFCFQWAIST